MIVYHKLIAEITGDDGREWLVSVEPPMKAALPGEPVKYEAEVKPVLTRQQLADRGGVEPEPFKYTIPSREGMFIALSMALNHVPVRD
jgi:hypothetical protein